MIHENLQRDGGVWLRSMSIFASRTWVLIFVLGALMVTVKGQAQESGTVSGMVISTWDASPLPSVVVTVRGTTLAVQTDGSGRFELANVPVGDQVLRFSKSGYATATVSDVRVLPGQTTTVNGNLRPEFYEMEEYEISAEDFTEQTDQIIFEKQQSSMMLDAIGSEQMSRLGADDAASVLGKVTGASVADGKFAVIRGLADRYTSTTLNGNDIPSADPDRKAAQLDLFPAQFIERMDVSKTFSPDMPGGFAGGAINIVTKSFPDKPFINFSLGTSYNTQSSLQDDFLETDHGSTDWLGMDDGTRELPAAAAATNPSGTAAPLNPAIKSSFGSRQFSPRVGSSPLNTSLSLNFGGATKVLDRKLGFMAGVSYDNDYNHYKDEEITKTVSQGSFIQPYPKVGAHSVIEYTWASMVTLGYEISENHDIGFNFMVVQSAEDEAKRYIGESDEPDTSGSPYIDQSELHWTERQLQYYQLHGQHDFPELQEVRLDWAGSMATASQDEPDQRFFQFYADPESNFYIPDGPSQPPRPTRIFRELTEDNASFRTDLTLPIPSYNTKSNSLKVGAAISKSERDYTSRGFDVRASGAHPFYQTGDPDSYLAPENQGFINYHNFAANFDYTGEQTITAWYGMADWATLEWLRLTGGARVESTDLSVDTVNTTLANQRFFAEIQQDDVLPSLAATISIRTNLLLRAAWSQTVIRPTYREISRAEIYDVARERIYQGNPELTMSDSQNYDLRLEWYPREGELISVGVFLKNIGDPIEMVSADISNDRVTFDNFEEAEVRGIEFEFRKNLGSWSQFLEELSLGFNYAYMESEVPIPADQQTLRRTFRTDYSATRPLYDQPEFVMNGDITWDHKDTGTAVTLSGGVVGRRLILVGISSPDEYEEPAPQLDFFISQRLSKNWKAKFSAKNLLNPKHEGTVTYPDFGKYVVETYTKGITFGISLSAEF